MKSVYEVSFRLTFLCLFRQFLSGKLVYVVLVIETALFPAGDRYAFFNMQLFENVQVCFYVQNIFFSLLTRG